MLKTLILFLIFIAISALGVCPSAAQDFESKATRDEKARYPDSFKDQSGNQGAKKAANTGKASPPANKGPATGNTGAQGSGKSGATLSPSGTSSADAGAKAVGAGAAQGAADGAKAGGGTQVANVGANGAKAGGNAAPDSAMDDLEARTFDEVNKDYERNSDQIFNDALDAKRAGDTEGFRDGVERLDGLRKEFEDMQGSFDAQEEFITEEVGKDLHEGARFSKDLKGAKSDAERDRIIDRARSGFYGPVGNDLRTLIDKIKEIRKAQKESLEAINRLEEGSQLLEETSGGRHGLAPTDPNPDGALAGYAVGGGVPGGASSLASQAAPAPVAVGPTADDLLVMRQSMLARQGQSPAFVPYVAPQADAALVSAANGQALLNGLQRDAILRDRERDRDRWRGHDGVRGPSHVAAPGAPNAVTLNVPDTSGTVGASGVASPVETPTGAVQLGEPVEAGFDLRELEYEWHAN